MDKDRDGFVLGEGAGVDPKNTNMLLLVVLKYIVKLRWRYVSRCYHIPHHILKD
jgi:hypothetical protein